MTCYEKPTSSNTWENNVDYSMFIDENNSPSSLNVIKRKIVNHEEIDVNLSVFTVTGCIFAKNNYQLAKERFDKLREKYWNNGMWLNPKNNELEKVCFHSEDIRGKKKAFAIFKEDEKQYEHFIIDLDKTINSLKYKIISININLKDYIFKSKYNEGNVYKIAFNFIIERFIYGMGDKNVGAIIFEARGKKEDSELLEHIDLIINRTGTEYITSDELKAKINGVYFNKKFNKNKTPYLGLQIADLSSYPIHRFIKFDTKGRDFLTIEKKIHCYPKYLGKGLKIYPKK